MKYITEGPRSVRGRRQVHPYFQCCTAEQEQQVLEAGHGYDRIFSASGFVIDRQFQTFRTMAASEKLDFRSELSFSSHLPVIVIALGAQGSSLMQKIARHLSAARLDVHFVFICGRNASTKVQLQRLRFKHQVAIRGYVRDFGRYLAIADYFVGKPGPGTVAEALFMQVPCFVISTGFIMEQEKGNIRLIQSRGVGDSFRSPKALIKRLSDELGQPKERLYPNLSEFAANDGLEVAYHTIKRLCARPDSLRASQPEQAHPRQ